MLLVVTTASAALLPFIARTPAALRGVIPVSFIPEIGGVPELGADPFDIVELECPGHAGQGVLEELRHAVLDLLHDVFCPVRTAEGAAQGVKVCPQPLEGGKLHLEEQVA